MISGVLFDLDGTLVDCIRPMEKAFVEIVEGLGVKITEQGRVNVADNLRSILIQKSSPFAGAGFLWRIGKYVGLSNSKTVLMLFLTFRRLKYLADHSPLFPGTLDLLVQLQRKNVKMGIVTTRSMGEAALILEQFSLIPFFGAIVTRDDATRGKPYPDPVLLALKRLSLKPEETVMIGDMPTDIESGKGAGVKTIGLLIGIFNKELAEINPDALAGSLAEIPAILDRL